jgi:hypothetical protein
MKLAALALDYDGTTASDSVFDGHVRDVIAEARRKGVVVILVTGRRIADLRQMAAPTLESLRQLEQPLILAFNRGRLMILLQTVAKSTSSSISRGLRTNRRLPDLGALLPLLPSLRRRTGLPHKVLLDEAHPYLYGPGADRLLDAELAGYILGAEPGGIAGPHPAVRTRAAPHVTRASSREISRHAVAERRAFVFTAEGRVSARALTLKDFLGLMVSRVSWQRG